MRFACILGIMALVIMTNFVSGLSNPAAVYCEELGYDFSIEKTTDGETGYCLVEENKFEAWNFYSGKIGQNYSYCASQGFDIKIANESESSFVSEYAICVNKTNSTEEVLQEELMDIEEKVSENRDKEKSDGKENIFINTGFATKEKFNEAKNAIRLASTKIKESNTGAFLLIVFSFTVVFALCILTWRHKK